AHSFYMGKDAFGKLKGDNKVFLPIEGATHTDLYDQIDKIPFKEMTDFFNKYLN
nr:alpha/beta hydrolase [Enterococcus faecalis]